MPSRPLPRRSLTGARSPSRLAVAGLSLATLLLSACGEEPIDPLAPVTSSAALSRGATDITFDWSMPDRFGADADQDGLIDYPSPEEITPASWTVVFDACGVPGEQYTWYVGGRSPVATVSACEYAHAFDAEGTYTVTLEVMTASGELRRGQEVVTVQDWLILSLGDSYASGQGAPEVPSATLQLIGAIGGWILDLQEAQKQLAIAEANWNAAWEEKGLADKFLADAKGDLDSFFEACKLDSFKSIKTCVDFLLGVPSETFADAEAFFQDGVDIAEERIANALAALEAVEAAIAAAQSAAANATTAIQEAQDALTKARWQPKYAVEVYNADDSDFVCYRSAMAAGARAALALEAADPRTSVTFVHLACSGATMTEGFRASLHQQITWADELVGDREVDAVLVSIGGNDAGFSSLAMACVTQEPCFENPVPVITLGDVDLACGPLSILGAKGCVDFFHDNAPQGSAGTLLEQGLAALPAAYAGIAEQSLPLLSGLREPRSGGQVIENGRPVAVPDRVRAERVYLVEYADMTKDETGAYCGQENLNPFDLFGWMPGVTVAEMTWLDQTALAGINGAGATAAEEHGWTRVTGVAAGFAQHGYCAKWTAPLEPQHWIVRLAGSYLLQGDFYGTAHPNYSGHAYTGEVIIGALQDDLYPAGIGTPRAPDQAQVQRVAVR